MKTSRPRNLVIWAVLFIGMMLTTACSDKNDVPDGFYLMKSLTHIFIMPDDESNRASENYTLKVNQYDDVLDVSVNGRYISSSNDPKLFNKLLDKYNDYFPKPILMEKGSIGDPVGSRVLGEVITGIEVKSLDAFNSTHKAGADMGDALFLEWVSYYDYIQGGYDHSAKNGNGPYIANEPCLDPKSTYHALIGDASIYPIRMVEFSTFVYPHLYFSQKPDAPGTYRFSVSFKFESCEATTTMTVKF